MILRRRERVSSPQSIAIMDILYGLRLCALLKSRGNLLIVHMENTEMFAKTVPLCLGSTLVSKVLLFPLRFIKVKVP